MELREEVLAVLLAANGSHGRGWGGGPLLHPSFENFASIFGFIAQTKGRMASFNNRIAVVAIRSDLQRILRWRAGQNNFGGDFLDRAQY